MENLIEFLQSQKLFTLATTNSSTPWVANVYMCSDEKGTLYFISSKDTRHSQEILANDSVAFATAWFNPDDSTDRKGVQGTGICRIAETEDEITKGVKLHNAKCPEFKERITIKWIHDNDKDSKVWIITPKYIKYWNDRKPETKEQEFNF